MTCRGGAPKAAKSRRNEPARAGRQVRKPVQIRPFCFIAGGRFASHIGGTEKMKLFGPLARAAAFAGLALAGAIAASPASAGPNEIALLESYIGSWSGRGQLTGAQ